MVNSLKSPEQFVPLLSAEEIAALVEHLGKLIGRNCSPPIHLICVLDAAFVFAADLVREISLPTYLHWIKVQSYVGTEGGEPRVLWTDFVENTGTRLLVDTIVDSGRTIRCVREYFADPALPVVALLARQETAVNVDFCGTVIPPGFVVGYGLDYRGEYRGLPEITILSAPPDGVDPSRGADFPPFICSPPREEV